MSTEFKRACVTPVHRRRRYRQSAVPVLQANQCPWPMKMQEGGVPVSRTPQGRSTRPRSAISLARDTDSDSEMGLFLSAIASCSFGFCCYVFLVF